MFKSKLYEHCQRNRLPAPIFTTTGSKEFSSTVTIELCTFSNDERLTRHSTFQSRESYSSKKKAEDDAAEVALAAANNLSIEGTTAINPSVNTNASMEDLLESIAKAVNLLNSNDFLIEESMPAECLLLFGGVQSALNRINPIHRKNSEKSLSCLLEALESPLQKVITLEQDGAKYLLRNKLAKSSHDSEMKPTLTECQTRRELQKNDIGTFVVIPSAENETPYEVQFALTSASSSTEHIGSDGIRMMEAMTAMYTAMKTSSNFSISTPLFIPTGENYKNNLSQLFNGDNPTEHAAADGTRTHALQRTEDSKDISSSQVIKPRLLIKYNQNRGEMGHYDHSKLNKVASWIGCYPVYGDAIVACMGFSKFEPTTLDTLRAILMASLPSGLWVPESVAKNFMALPSSYYSPTWSLSGSNIIAAKTPSTILQEMMIRRTLSVGFSKTETPLLELETEQNVRKKTFEEVPLDGWWSAGVSAEHKNPKVEADISGNDKKNIPGKVTLSIRLPESEGLYSTSGTEFVSSKIFEKGSPDIAEEFQNMCLQALNAIQACGEKYLESLSYCLRTFTCLEEPEHSLNAHELGEDSDGESDGNSHECSAENPAQSSIKNMTRIKKEVYFVAINITPIQNHPDKIMNELSNETAVDGEIIRNATNFDVSEFRSQDSESGSSSHQKPDNIEEKEMSAKRICSESRETNQRGITDRNDVHSSEAMVVQLLDDKTDYNSSNDCLISDMKKTGHTGCTVKSYTGMGILPPAIENQLALHKTGDRFEINLSSAMQNHFSLFSFPHNTDSGSTDPKEFLSSQKGDINHIEKKTRLYKFNVTILEKKEHDSQPVNKKALPNLFYPSLAVQRRRFLAAFLRASKADSWLDVGCGTCVVMESFLSNNVNQSDCGNIVNANVLKSSAAGDAANFTVDTAMIVPALRHMAGLECNAIPLNSAQKNMLSKLPSSCNCKSDLESVTLWHGSILDLGVEESMLLDLNRREKEGNNKDEEGGGETEGEEVSDDQVRGQGEDIEGGTSFTQQNENFNAEIKMGVGVSGSDETSNRSPLLPPSVHTTPPSPLSKQQKKYQAITCIEVIEHLPTQQDAAIALETILCKYKPDFAFFSTPNYESNGAIRRAATNMISNKTPNDSVGKQKDNKIESDGVANISISASNLKNDDLLDVPMDVDEVEVEVAESFREADHKFEFTRQQFRDWACEGVRVSAGEYEVTFSEVGASLPGMRDKGGLDGDEQVHNLGDKDKGKAIEEGDEKERENVLVGDVCGMERGRYIDVDGSLRRSRERGCGGASQVAIFRRIKVELENSGTVKNDDVRKCSYAADKKEEEIEKQDMSRNITEGNIIKNVPASLFWRWNSSQ